MVFIPKDIMLATMAKEQDEELLQVRHIKNHPSMLCSEKFVSLTKDRFYKEKRLASFSIKETCAESGYNHI